MTGLVSAGGRKEAPSGSELAGPIGRSLVIGRSDRAAIVITHIEAYTEGLAFDLQLRIAVGFGLWYVSYILKPYPDNEVVFSAQWPQLEIPESSGILTEDELRRARADISQLFPRRQQT